MRFKRVWQLHGVQAAVQLLVLVGLAWCLVQGAWAYALPLAGMAGGIVYGQMQRQRQIREEVQHFTEAIRYRDFSRLFTTRDMPPDLRAVRASFNEIIGSFKDMSRERETQYHYLHNVLELVDTGILSYEPATGEVLWANDTLKKQLQLPYIKTMRGLDRRHPSLTERIKALTPGDRQVVTLWPESVGLRLLLSATVFQTDGRQYKLIACQNISEAMDETESKAWQRLLSVMTHEIMNSVAPIASLAQTLHERLELENASVIDESTAEDLRLGIETIQRRSTGLLKFAGTYRNMSKVTVGDLRTVRVWDMVDAVYRLMQLSLQDKEIAFDIVLPDPELTIQADPTLIEQVLINLMVNAIDAVKDVPAPRITLTASATDNNRTEIKVLDNGAGIAADVLDSIFIPFFTTKKNGSGIGLSLSKQIMMLHRGTIRVASEPGKGTLFTLVF